MLRQFLIQFFSAYHYDWLWCENYADRRYQHNFSHHRKAEFDDCFIIHLKLMNFEVLNVELPSSPTFETLAYVLAGFPDVNICFFFLHMLFKEQIAMDAIFFSSLSFQCKYFIDQRRFHANMLSNQWYIARIFQFWSTTAGRKWLTGNFSLRNGEIIWWTDNCLCITPVINMMCYYLFHLFEKPYLTSCLPLCFVVLECFVITSLVLEKETLYPLSTSAMSSLSGNPCYYVVVPD